MPPRPGGVAMAAMVCEGELAYDMLLVCSDRTTLAKSS
jgi:hypothetical protein